MCVMCMKRTAAPHNGGLCTLCAPPLKSSAGKSLRWPHNHKMKLSLRHVDI